MHIFDTIGILTTLTAAFALTNYHLLRLPTTIALMLQSLLCSVALMTLLGLGVDTVGPARQFLSGIDFNELLLQGLLSFLLFAGALFVKNEELLEVRWDIAIFATVGVIISTGIIGAFLMWASDLLQLKLRPIYCFLFGALISPTDPVAVLPILRSHGIAKRLNAQIAGEALFNDGIGIVLFLSLLSMAKGEGGHLTEVLFLFLSETGGGLALGGGLGWVGYRLMKTVDNYQLEILISLALASGGYSLARAMGVSGPLAMVATGLLIGGPGRRLAMSEQTRENLDRFWELVEEMLNSVLFTLIGLEILAVITRLHTRYLVTAGLAVPLVLLGRLLSVSGISFLLTRCGNVASRRVPIMTWSGLRGGISIALALSVPGVSERGPLLLATYAVVAFSILVQGTTLKYLVAGRHE